MKFCVRCENLIFPGMPKYFRSEATWVNGALKRTIEFFCEACFALHDPVSASRLRK